MGKLSVSYAQRRQKSLARLLVWPAAMWMIVFFAIPLVVVLVYSFMTADSVTLVKLPFTLNHYERALRPTYTTILWRSLVVAILTTVITALLAYPLAFFIATRPPRIRNIFLLLVVIPFWTNFLIRTYAWLFILSNNGPLNTFITDYLKLTSTPLNLIGTPAAVLTGLVYGELPFMILPLYTSMEKFNFRMVEAAHDLGANDWKAFWRVVLPLTMPGLIAGSILVFIPSIGAYVTPDLLGGAKALMIGTQISDAMKTTTGKPFGAALSFILIGVVAIALLIYFKLADQDSAHLG